MPEYIVVRCYSCRMHQCIQVNQKRKFSCKICSTAQAVKAVLGSASSGRELRPLVQELNMRLQDEDIAVDEERRRRATSLALENPPSDSGSSAPATTTVRGDPSMKWGRFCSSSSSSADLNPAATTTTAAAATTATAATSSTTAASPFASFLSSVAASPASKLPPNAQFRTTFEDFPAKSRGLKKGQGKGKGKGKRRAREAFDEDGGGDDDEEEGQGGEEDWRPQHFKRAKASTFPSASEGPLSSKEPLSRNLPTPLRSSWKAFEGTGPAVEDGAGVFGGFGSDCCLGAKSALGGFTGDAGGGGGGGWATPAASMSRLPTSAWTSSSFSSVSSFSSPSAPSEPIAWKSSFDVDDATEAASSFNAQHSSKQGATANTARGSWCFSPQEAQTNQQAKLPQHLRQQQQQQQQQPQLLQSNSSSRASLQPASSLQELVPPSFGGPKVKDDEEVAAARATTSSTSSGGRWARFVA